MDEDFLKRYEYATMMTVNKQNK